MGERYALHDTKKNMQTQSSLVIVHLLSAFIRRRAHFTVSVPRCRVKSEENLNLLNFTFLVERHDTFLCLFAHFMSG
jgi:hypothetical protein